MSERASMRINNATLRLKARLSREPTHEELASELNLDLPEFYKLYDSAISYELHSLDAPPPTYEGPATEAGDFYANRHSLETQLQRADSPYELALNTQLRAKFTQAVNHLDPQHREVFQLYYQQQLSVRTICKRLGKANRTVAKLLNNSLLQLSATINPSPVPPPTTQRHAQFQPIRPPCKPLSLALSTC
jgi:RNA polymerase sigma factor (sigma-70 family)